MTGTYHSLRRAGPALPFVDYKFERGDMTARAVDKASYLCGDIA
jgi:hypothetical protein